MTEPQNIICFAKDWDEHPTSNNHVMRELARQGHRVLWLNSISTRAPKLSSGRDVKKILRKVKSFFTGLKRVDERMWVYTPIVLPFPHSRFATAINRYVLRLSVKLLRRRLDMHEFQLWTFLPNVAEYVGTMGESVSVYYCTDEWSQFNYVDGPRIAAAERRLCERVDVVFATAQSLVDYRRQFNAEVHLATHGVDHEAFSQALDRTLDIPCDLTAMSQPILGFYGTIQDWVDLKLIEFLAQRHPEWSIVMIGDVFADVSFLKRYPNVHFPGRRSHLQLPACCRAFSVGLIPYALCERIMHVNPLKLREYFCAGLPVVSTALPEVERYRDLCCVANSYEAFERGIIRELQRDTVERRHERSERMRSETWTQKVNTVCSHVSRVLAATLRGRKALIEGKVAGPPNALSLELQGPSDS